QEGPLGTGTISNTVIYGDYIGLDQTGDAPVPNGNGIVLTGVLASQQITNTRIGMQIGWNHISGNKNRGVLLQGPGVINTQVACNVIGLDANGCTAVGNGLDGVVILSGASNNTIGAILGTGNAGNVISGNGRNGVDISGNNPAG